jgi:hypothetical protein
MCGIVGVVAKFRNRGSTRQDTMSNSRALDKFCLVLWALFLLAVPFHFLGKEPVNNAGAMNRSLKGTMQAKVEGGVPQVADYVMLALMALVVGGFGLPLLPRHLPVVRAFGAFVCYVAVVNLVWTMVTGDQRILKNSLFYVYDYLLFLTLLALYARLGEKFLRVTVHAAAASVFLQVILSPVAPDTSSFRNALFFNNANQLGYYAILAATLFYFGSKRFPMKVAYQACFYLAVVYLNFMCLSKAALLAGTVLLVLVLLQRPALFIAGVGAVALLLGGMVLVKDATPAVLTNLEKRITTRESDETWATRGWDRIANHPEQLFLGGGEGYYERFESVINYTELHSSWGTLLFCYGVLGTAPFAYGLYLIGRRADLTLLAGLLPTLVYGLFHQGLRFTLFWAVLGVLCCLMRGPDPARLPTQAARGRDPRGLSAGRGLFAGAPSGPSG